MALRKAREGDDDESQRWKDKYLNALEEHEEREQLLSSRIQLLRRGLLGVSLAGEGLDGRLDAQLNELRSMLRTQDREAGLEGLLEQIEKSILRLDAGKQEKTAALVKALSLSITELEQAPLSRDLRRRLKRFSRKLPEQAEETGGQAGLIRAFLQMLREAVRELDVTPPEPDGKRSLWQRLWGGGQHDPDTPSGDEETSTGSAAEKEPRSAAARTAAAPVRDESAGSAPDQSADSAPDEPTHFAPDKSAGSASDESAGSAPDQSAESVPEDAAPESPETDDSAEPPSEGEVITAETTSRIDSMDLARDEAGEERETTRDREAPEDEDSLEGELIRDGMGLQEPGFSFIAGHVEPVLLRILENVYIADQSRDLAEEVRRKVGRGLNWYEFVAVLEDILAVIVHSIGSEREDLESFLNEVTENLATVQAFVDSSDERQRRQRDVDAGMEESVRREVDRIAASVHTGTNLEELRHNVQEQLENILASLEQFRGRRQEQDDAESGQVREMQERIEAMEEEAGDLRHHLSEQRENALLDTLTGLPNREAYDRHLREAMATPDRGICLAVCDVDWFKELNDRYGHLAGDKVLKILSREFGSCLRSDDFVARYGGEEFVIVMPATRLEEAQTRLESLREAVEAIPFHFKRESVSVTVSVGLTACHDDDNPDTLFDRADQAMYRAKEDGRNCCRTFPDPP